MSSLRIRETCSSGPVALDNRALFPATAITCSSLGVVIVPRLVGLLSPCNSSLFYVITTQTYIAFSIHSSISTHTSPALKTLYHPHKILFQPGTPPLAKHGLCHELLRLQAPRQNVQIPLPSPSLSSLTPLQKKANPTPSPRSKAKSSSSLTQPPNAASPRNSPRSNPSINPSRPPTRTNFLSSASPAINS